MEFDGYTIRLIQEEDLTNFFRTISANRSRLETFFAGTVSKTRTLEDTEVYIAEVLKKIEDKIYFPFVILNEEKEIIGFIDVKNIDWNLPKGEIGCFMDESYASKGIARKSLTYVISHLFKDFGFNKLFLRTHESNLSARRLAEKCGFEVEGVLRKDYKTTSGELVDLIYYGLLKEHPNTNL